MAMIDEVGQIVGDLKSLHDNSTRPQLGKSGDPIAWIELYNQNLNVENVNIFVTKQEVLGSYLIYNHSTYGSWNVGSWGNFGSSNGSFVTQRLLDLKLHQFFTEEFDNTTYKDTGSTTAPWSTSGSVVIASEGIIQSLKTLGSNVIVGSFNRVTTTVQGSNLSLLTIELALDGGNFSEVVNGTETTFTSNLGSDVRFRLTNTDVANDANYDIDIYDSAEYDGAKLAIVYSVDLEAKSGDY